MPRIRHLRNGNAADAGRRGVEHHPVKYVNVNDGRPCVGSDYCAHEPVPDCPIRLCPKHLREVYGFASDLITANWDSGVREYVSDLHDTFKPPRVVKQPLSGWVYFIRFGDRVKIGYTTKPTERIKALPHEQAIGVVAGTRQDETAWHRLLADFHVVGEWFRADPELLATLERVVERSA